MTAPEDSTVPVADALDIGALAGRIVAAAEQPHLLVDRSGTIPWSNAAFRRMWSHDGTGDEDLPSMALADLLRPNVDPSVVPFLRDMAARSIPVRITEVELAFRDPVAHALRFVGEADPAGGGVLLYAPGVTEGTNALQRQFQAAIDTLEDGFALYDAEDRLVMANARYREFFSYSSQMIRPGVRFETILREGLKHGMPPHAVGREEAWLARKLHEHRLGVGWHERSLGGRWLRIFERRTPGGWHVALRMDITPMKAREARLSELHRLAQERLEMLDSVLENIRVGVHLFDDDLLLRYRNTTFLRMIGLTPAELPTGTPFDRLIRMLWDRGHYDGADLEGELSRRRALLQSPDHGYRRDRKDGSVVEVRGWHLPSGGILSTYRDVTEDQRLRRDLESARDAAEAASRAKSDFLATMSHEIRTPMNGVLGMAAALAETGLDAEQRRMLDVIVDSGNVLQALLSDLLDLAQAEAGELAIVEKPFRAVEIVEPLSEMHRRRAAERGLSVSVTLSEGSDGVRLGDPLRLRQVLDNLLSNALKFTDRGGVSVEVDAVALPETEGAGPRPPGLRFRVIDTGPGIAAEDQDRLFRPFRRLDVSRTRETGGTGLGLAICRRLVEAMGGRITLHSAPGAGTRVDVEIPAPLAASDTPTDAARLVARRPAEMPTGLRVLVAEDIPTNQLVLTHLLRGAKADVTLVADGAAAVEAAVSGRFDLILMDIMMPRMDGVAATRAIRDAETRRGRPRTPIVALTANALQQDVDSYLAEGMDAHIGKPIDPVAMRRTIARVMGRVASAGEPR